LVHPYFNLFFHPLFSPIMPIYISSSAISRQPSAATRAIQLISLSSGCSYESKKGSDRQ